LTVPRLLEDFNKGRLKPRYDMPYMVEHLYWGHKWAKGQVYAYGSVAQWAIQRAKQNSAHELLNIADCGLGYRSKFYFAADSAPVNVYRDMTHLPPQEELVVYLFPYPQKSKFREGLIYFSRGMCYG
jgi:hypothetical protein